MSCERKHRVLRELQHTIYVEDPLAYYIDKGLIRSSQDRKHKLIAFYDNSKPSKDILEDGFWKRVDYEYLPTKNKWGTTIVWFEFLGKHIQIIN